MMPLLLRSVPSHTKQYVVQECIYARKNYLFRNKRSSSTDLGRGVPPGPPLPTVMCWQSVLNGFWGFSLEALCWPDYFLHFMFQCVLFRVARSHWLCLRLNYFDPFTSQGVTPGFSWQWHPVRQSLQLAPATSSDGAADRHRAWLHLENIMHNLPIPLLTPHGKTVTRRNVWC